MLAFVGYNCYMRGWYMKIGLSLLEKETSLRITKGEKT